MAVASVQPSSPRWLFGPWSDLLLGCGLLYAVVFCLYAVAGPSLREATPFALIPLAILLLSAPHYGATLVRVYDQRADRRAYVLFAVWATLALLALFLFTLRDPFLGSVMFTLALTWSPWHYTGQNYGLAVMFARRRGMLPTPAAKRWLYASFVLSFVLTAIAIHLEVGSAYSPLDYEGTDVTFLPVGITRGFGDVVLPIVGAAYVVSLVTSAVLLRRGGRWRDLAPIGALMLTQALWFSLPFSVQYWGWHTGIEPLDAHQRLTEYVVLIAIGHALQYLWVTTYYARAGGQWHGYGRYWLKVLAAGIAIWTLPVLLIDPSGWMSGPGYVSSLLLLVSAFVNLHHFVLDGAIWKLRNSRIAGVLIRSTAAEEVATPSRSGLRVAVWSVAGFGMVAGLGGYFATEAFARQALERGDVPAASRALQIGAWLGGDHSTLRGQLAQRHLASGDLDTALAEADRMLEIRADGGAYALLGRVHGRRGETEGSRVAYENALTHVPAPTDPHRVHAALAALALGRGDEATAVGHYGDALELRPGWTSIANNLAWVLATADDPAARDPERSVALAEDVVAEAPNANHLETLAEAYAAAGRFEDAVAAAERAATQAEAEGSASLPELRRGVERHRASLRAASLR